MGLLLNPILISDMLNLKQLAGVIVNSRYSSATIAVADTVHWSELKTFVPDAPEIPELLVKFEKVTFPATLVGDIEVVIPFKPKTA